MAGTFHQDIDSPEEALDDLLTKESKEYLESSIAFLTNFILNEYSDVEKSEYIQYCADGVYFPDFGLEPLQWLYGVIERIKEAVKTK